MNKQLPPQYVFWFIVGSSLAVFCYVFAITFLPIPEKNIRHADTALAFFMGTVLGGGMAYYVGASPDKKDNKEKEPNETEE